MSAEPVLVDLDDLATVHTLASTTTYRHEREQAALERIARLLAAADPDGPDAEYRLDLVRRPRLVVAPDGITVEGGAAT